MSSLASIARSSLSLLLGSSLLVSALIVPVPARAAGMPVFDVANFLTNTVQTTITQTLNGIAWGVAKTAIQSMTKSIVNWINSGYQGEPAFSQNLQRDLRQVGDGAANLFVYNLNKNIEEGKINSPFAAEVVQLTKNAYLLATSDDLLEQRLKYTIIDYTRDSVRYMRGDLPPRGLQDWHAMTFQCGNDPFCTSYAMQEELVSQVSGEVGAWLRDLTNGRGFLSWKGECTQYKSAMTANAATARSGPCDPANYDESACMALLSTSAGGGVAENVSLSDADECVAHDYLTPGAVVEQTLGITVNSPLRQLELADSINEIVGAVVTQMVNQVMGGTGLTGLSAPRPGGGSRPIDTATNPNTSNTIGDGFESIVASERDRTIASRTAWIEIRDAALAAQDACPAAGGTVAAFRSSIIRDVIERADRIIARADVALTGMDEVLVLLETANEPGLFSSSQTTSSQRAWDTYQRLLTQGKLLSSQEHSDAAVERSEEADSNSLYLRMKEYEDECN